MQKRRNIRMIYAFNFLEGLVFFLPIFALYLQQELFTVFNVTLILAVQSFATMVFEVPSGAIADLFGRKNTLIASTFFGIIGLIFLGIGGSLIYFIIYALVSAFARSMLSGTDTALLFDTIKNIDKQTKEEAIALSELSVGKEEVIESPKSATPRFKKVIAINNSMWPIGASISSIIGGILATFSFKIPIFVTIIPFSLALLVACFLYEPEYEKEPHKNIFRHMFKSSKTLIKNRQVLLLSLAGLLFFSFGEVAHQLNPVFYNFKNIPVAYYGFIFAGTFGLSSVGSLISDWFSNRMGNRSTVIISALIPPFLLFGATFVLGIWAAILIVLGSLFWGIRWPIMTHLLNLEVQSKNRATVMSISNLANKLGLAIFAPFFGFIVDLYNINTAFRLAAGLSFVVVILLLFIEEKD